MAPYDHRSLSGVLEGSPPGVFALNFESALYLAWIGYKRKNGPRRAGWCSGGGGCFGVVILLVLVFACKRLSVVCVCLCVLGLCVG